MTVTPDDRLLGAASYVRREAYFADIGTDHAILPVFLLEKGVISRAVASDIAKGPLESARHTVEAAGLGDKVTLMQVGGLDGMEALGLTDIAICGLGGEMIADILGAAPFVRDPAVRLILQPMTKGAYLRLWLAREGFSIADETLCRAKGKTYSCLLVSYTGESYALTPAEAELGRANLEKRHTTPLFRTFLEEKIFRTRKQLEGMRVGGLDTQEIQSMLEELERYQ